MRADSEGKHEAVGASVEKLLRLVNDDADVRGFFRSANERGMEATPEQVKAAAGKLKEVLGLDDITTEFISVMYGSGVMGDAESVLENYIKMLRKKKKEVPVKLTCTSVEEAKAFGASAEFKDILQEYLEAGERPLLSYRADPSILGGYRLDVGPHRREFTLAGLVGSLTGRLQSAHEEEAKGLMRELDSTPMFVSREQARRDLPVLQAHPLAKHFKLDAMYGQ
jgi:F0F1-type ATP synthase delta subunit